LKGKGFVHEKGWEKANGRESLTHKGRRERESKSQKKGKKGEGAGPSLKDEAGRGGSWGGGNHGGFGFNWRSIKNALIHLPEVGPGLSEIAEKPEASRG